MRKSNLIKRQDKTDESKSGVLYGALWAFLAAIIAFIFLFFFAYGLFEIKSISNDSAEIFAYILYDLIIGIACYMICRRYPKSVLVVPVVANIMGFVSSIFEPNFWNSYIWVLIVCGWILSIVTSLAGYLLTKRGT
jgi:hypothetical protein